MQHREGQTLLVFNFGGGTCDLAVFRLYRPSGAPMRARLIGTSRCHRLGGGDIDCLIVHRHLLPKPLKQSGMREADLDFRQKKVVLEPQLLALAESLKIALCKRIDKENARLQYRDALDTGTPPEDLNGFELQWLQRASNQLGDKRMSTAVTEERNRRSKASQDSERGQRVGVLPEVLKE